MVNQRSIFFVFLIGIFGYSAFAQSAVASGGQAQPETLIQLTDKLKKNAGDTALREQIIKVANETKSAPTIPEEARQHFVEGNTLAKAAKDLTGQKLAVESFQKALLAAPWWADAYYNLAVAQGLAGQFEAAQSSLKFYILTKPGEKEAREAQDKIYELNAKKKLAEAEAAQKEAARKAVEDTPEAREKRFLAGLEGAVFSRVYKSISITVPYTRTNVVIRGGDAVMELSFPFDYEPPIDFNVDRRETIRLTSRVQSVTQKSNMWNDDCQPWTLTISDDARTLTFSCYWPAFKVSDTWKFTRVR